MSGTERFVYDGADVVRDLDGSNATVTEYLNGLGVDNKLRQTISGNVSYFIIDHLRLTHAKAPNTLLDLQYQFNANNITQMIDGAGTHNCTYGTLGRPHRCHSCPTNKRRLHDVSRSIDAMVGT